MPRQGVRLWKSRVSRSVEGVYVCEPSELSGVPGASTQHDRDDSGRVGAVGSNAEEDFGHLRISSTALNVNS